MFARSFFAQPTEFSAGELVAMFHSYFLGSAEGLLFDVPVDDYDTALWAPLAGYLSRSGVDIRTGQRVSAIDAAGDGPVRVTCGDDEIAASAVVVAADPATTPHPAARQRDRR